MLPFVYVDPTKMGIVQPFGLLVAIAFAVTDYLGFRRCRKLGYDVAALKSLRVWIIASSLFFAHFLDELVCHPAYALAHPLSLLYVWNGLSSFGGFVGTLIGGLGWKFLTFRRPGSLVALRTTPYPMLPMADLVMAVFPVGWAFGRAGCSIVHDHPGLLAPPGAWLSVAWPAYEGEGLDHVYGPIHLIWGSVARWDLGLLELLFTIALAAAFAATWSRKLPIGSYVVAACLAYAPVRFFMDALRIDEGADPRWLGMTFAQFCTLGLFAFGLILAVSLVRRAKGAEGPIAGAHSMTSK